MHSFVSVHALRDTGKPEKREQLEHHAEKGDPYTYEYDVQGGRLQKGTDFLSRALSLSLLAQVGRGI